MLSQRFLHRRIGQVEPQLQEVHSSAPETARLDNARRNPTAPPQVAAHSRIDARQADVVDSEVFAETPNAKLLWFS